MEKRGIRTRIGDFNRWVKRTRRRIKTLFEKLTAVTEALAEMRREAQEQAVTMAMMLGEAHVEKNSQMLQKTSA